MSSGFYCLQFVMNHIKLIKHGIFHHVMCILAKSLQMPFNKSPDQLPWKAQHES